MITSIHIHNNSRATQVKQVHLQFLHAYSIKLPVIMYEFQEISDTLSL